MSLAQSINEFNRFWEKHGDRQEEVLDALGEEWTDTAETFIGYDGQEGEFHLSDKVINHTKFDAPLQRSSAVTITDNPLTKATGPGSTGKRAPDQTQPYNNKIGATVAHDIPTKLPAGKTPGVSA